MFLRRVKIISKRYWVCCSHPIMIQISCRVVFMCNFYFTVYVTRLLKHTQTKLWRENMCAASTESSYMYHHKECALNMRIFNARWRHLLCTRHSISEFPERWPSLIFPKQHTSCHHDVWLNEWCLTIGITNTKINVRSNQTGYLHTCAIIKLKHLWRLVNFECSTGGARRIPTKNSCNSIFSRFMWGYRLFYAAKKFETSGVTTLDVFVLTSKMS